MIFTININQKAIIDNGWDLGLNELAIFDAMHKIFTTFPRLQKKIMDDKEWYWIDYELIKKQLPLLKHEENWFRQILKKLQTYGLIEINPENQKLAKTYFRMGENAYKMFSNSDLNEPLSKPIKVAETSIQTSSTPLSNPIDNNYTNYYVVKEVGENEKNAKTETLQEKLISKVGEKVELNKSLEDRLPTLEGVIALAKICWRDKLWLEQVRMNTSTTEKELGDWMKLFNLHISNTENIIDVTERKYKVLFLGWVRAKKASGVKISDYKPIKEQITSPLRSGKL